MERSFSHLTPEQMTADFWGAVALGFLTQVRDSWPHRCSGVVSLNYPRHGFFLMGVFSQTRRVDGKNGLDIREARRALQRVEAIELGWCRGEDNTSWAIVARAQNRAHQQQVVSRMNEVLPVGGLSGCGSPAESGSPDHTQLHDSPP
jgi:hypothetical protein